MVRLIILVLCLISSSNLIAETALPKSLLLSYVAHPAVTQTHIPIIKQVYKNLGIGVKFFPAPTERGFLQMNSAVTDGDVIRPLARIVQYENLIKVGPVLDNVRFVIFCRAEKACTPEILNNPTITILTSVEFKAFEFSANWKANVYVISKLENFSDLFKSKKFDYFTYALSQRENYQHNFENVNYFVLKDMPSYHVLHKKYRFMQEQISAAIKQVFKRE